MRLVFLRPRARRDLEEIWDYTAASWSARQAESYIRHIQQTVQLLADDPYIGRPCDEIRPGYRKHPSGSHIVFYRLRDDGIEVVRMLHRRMDFGQHL